MIKVTFVGLRTALQAIDLSSLVGDDDDINIGLATMEKTHF